MYKKRLVFEIEISHNYSDLIVLNCVELMTCDKKRVLRMYTFSFGKFIGTFKSW